MTQQPNTCHITLWAKCLATRITLLCALCLAVCHAVPALAATSDKARQLVRQAANAAVHKDYRQSSALLFKARSEAEAQAAVDLAVSRFGGEREIEQILRSVLTEAWNRL